ncbi:hypothetical protein IQ07DRAFT_85750 [Pyrenochaeta sp. DS3sAY3a]|nr:hypothetical protein IQ07DRAFT_85750 [Pyrenochaeta sp. DS3sAY3a]
MGGCMRWFGMGVGLCVVSKLCEFVFAEGGWQCDCSCNITHHRLDIVWFSASRRLLPRTLHIYSHSSFQDAQSAHANAGRLINWISKTASAESIPYQIPRRPSIALSPGARERECVRASHLMQKAKKPKTASKEASNIIQNAQDGFYHPRKENQKPHPINQSPTQAQKAKSPITKYILLKQPPIA